MNGGKFSTLRFSITGQASTKARHVVFISDFHGSIGVARIRERVALFTSNLHGTLQIISGKPQNAIFSSNIKNCTNIYLEKPRQKMFTSVVAMTFNLNKLISNSVVFVGNVYNNATISKETRRISVLNSTVLCSVNVSKLMRHQNYFTSIVNAFVSVIHTITETTTIDVTIPSGSELRIDSDNFIVLLNGQNIIHLHSGDWVTIDRNLLEMTIDTGSGGYLSGQVLFNERYL